MRCDDGLRERGGVLAGSAPAMTPRCRTGAVAPRWHPRSSPPPRRLPIKRRRGDTHAAMDETRSARLSEASSAFATPPPTSVAPGAAPAPAPQELRAGKGAQKQNEKRAFDLAF